MLAVQQIGEQQKRRFDEDGFLILERLVDIAAESYHIARHYMIRLSPEDFTDAQAVGRYAAVAGMTVEAFRDRFHLRGGGG